MGLRVGRRSADRRVREAPITDFCLPFDCDENVAGTDVAMNDVHGVSKSQALGNIKGETEQNSLAKFHRGILV